MRMIIQWNEFKNEHRESKDAWSKRKKNLKIHRSIKTIHPNYTISGGKQKPPQDMKKYVLQWDSVDVILQRQMVVAG